MKKPNLNKNISIKDFKDYYWLKEDLVRFCKEIGINCSGGKIEIASRISHYLETMILIKSSNTIRKKANSNFDWNLEKLDANTIITDNYKNTENVREFFKNKIGSNFKFNVEFMDWMKANTGKTLGDAITKYQQIAQQKKDKNYKTEIAPQFEYNTYIRDFLNHNPGLTIKNALECWKIKREKAGVKKYEKQDLAFMKSKQI
jgi:hypothetical protein